MRLAWFSPVPPARSGIAAYSADLLPHLAADHAIDVFVDRPGEVAGARVLDAHDFVWRHRLAPYDLVVYHLGNAPCHDYMWAYLARHPGLLVLHDARLHQARARQLLQAGRFDDYRAEFRFDHPGAVQDFAEYAIEGLGGPIYYYWPMRRAALQAARAVAVHNARVAADLQAECPRGAVATIRMGVPGAPGGGPSGAPAIRAALAIPPGAVVFAAFGRITAEKRIGAILRAIAALSADGIDAYLLLVGEADGFPLAREVAALSIAGRVRATGYVPDDRIGVYLAAADVCLCLRWPTALETSASWLRCLAAARPTVVSDLAHLVDIPAAVAPRVNLLDEDRSLQGIMRQLAVDRPRRDALAAAGQAWWAAGHTLSHMVDDYRQLLQDAAARPPGAPPELPAHMTAGHMALARSIARDFGVAVDLLA
ncbi:MAG: glycosyltransferase [Acidobacteria bacterium]|nr:glycosyltransferase [Acidobacteriota bacterium]